MTGIEIGLFVLVALYIVFREAELKRLREDVEYLHEDMLLILDVICDNPELSQSLADKEIEKHLGENLED